MFRKALFITILCVSLLYAPFSACATSSQNSGYYYWDDGSYYGQLHNGVPHGYGTSTYINGETYKGQWSEGLMNGRGTYNWPDGKLYVGNWKSGHMNGQGLIIYSDGTTYSGEFYQDRPTGNGEKRRRRHPGRIQQAGHPVRCQSFHRLQAGDGSGSGCLRSCRRPNWLG